MQCAAAGLPILHFLKARLDELPFGLPRGEGHHPPPKKCAYMEVNDAGDEQDMLAGKGKAADVGGVGRAGPSTTTKCLQLSGRSEVTEGGIPANQQDRVTILQVCRTMLLISSWFKFCFL
jgi:hypothetical protein